MDVEIGQEKRPSYRLSMYLCSKGCLLKAKRPITLIPMEDVADSRVFFEMINIIKMMFS